jgi:hypothetical protein
LPEWAVASIVKDRERLATFIVVPDGSVHGHPLPEVEIVEVGQLEKRLRELAS